MPTVIRLIVSFALLLCLSLPAWGQILTKAGDPVMVVTDPSKAVALGKSKAKAPPLTAGKQVSLLEEKDGLAQVSVDSDEPGAGLFDAHFYRLPMAALKYLPGKTNLDRPAWLPSAPTAGTEARDVLAYESGDAIYVRSGTATPRRIDRGSLPAVSPDGAYLAYTPKTGAGVMLVSLDGAQKPQRVGSGKEPVRQKAFCPDGSKLAWFVDGHFVIQDRAKPEAKPTVVAGSFGPDTEFQGFAKDCAALVVHNDAGVSWLGLDGKTLRSTPAGAFANDESTSGGGLYVPSPVDANLLLLVLPTAGTLAYHKWANDMSGALYLYDTASGTNYRLTPKTLAVATAAWSPDGKRIFFGALPETPANGPHHLYRINADGTGLTDLGPGSNPSVGMLRQ